jgi:hypothetical protein
MGKGKVMSRVVFGIAAALFLYTSWPDTILFKGLDKIHSIRQRYEAKFPSKEEQKDDKLVSKLDSLCDVQASIEQGVYSTQDSLTDYKKRVEEFLEKPKDTLDTKIHEIIIEVVLPDTAQKPIVVAQPKSEKAYTFEDIFKWD